MRVYVRVCDCQALCVTQIFLLPSRRKAAKLLMSFQTKCKHHSSPPERHRRLRPYRCPTSIGFRLQESTHSRSGARRQFLQFAQPASHDWSFVFAQSLFLCPAKIVILIFSLQALRPALTLTSWIYLVSQRSSLRLDHKKFPDRVVRFKDSLSITVKTANEIVSPKQSTSRRYSCSPHFSWRGWTRSDAVISAL